MKKVIQYFFVACIAFIMFFLAMIQLIQFYTIGQLQTSITDIKNELTQLKTSPTAAVSVTPTLTLTPAVTTSTTPNQTMTVKLYYKNYKSDPEVLNCEAFDYVERIIPKSSTPLADSIKLLITNQLTSSEKTQGLASEFNTTDPSKKSSAKLTLVSATIINGTAKLTLNDPEDFTGGGSCRSGILASQFSKTAKQFPSVNDVVFQPDTLFQP